MDLEATERNLQAALAAESTDPGRAEVLTQLARVESVRGRLDFAHSLLDEASSLAGDDDVAQARLLLECGRVLRRSDGDATALPVLEQAYHAALAAGQHFMAADAAHSCALVGDMVAWTNRGLGVAERFDAARYWRGTLLMNLGDWQWERGEYEASRKSFEASLEARRREARNPQLTEYARYGLARALRGLGRPAEAIPLLEEAVKWVEKHPTDPETTEVRQELAAAYDEVGRADEAAAQRAAFERERGGDP
ncbi:MAG TPA: tetratricopeptide repeat protein [Gaiellaceae bacterium]|nr:tetratricopeptide repeat protein [Gaiellaceae bacterium]